MSIYLKKKELQELEKKIDIKIYFDDIILVAFDCKKKLYYKDYDEIKLENFVNKYPECKINYTFWNNEYCSVNNINNDDINDLTKNLKILIHKNNQFTAGYIISMIYFYDIIYQIYTINDTKIIDDLKIDKYIFTNFLLCSKDKFYLDNTFIYFLEKILDSSNIHKFIFRKNNVLTLEETKILLEKIPIEDIHSASYKLFSCISNPTLRLKYANLLIDSFNEDVDLEEYTYIDTNISNLGIFLLNMNLEDDQITDYYIDTLNKYKSKVGNFKFTYSTNIKNNIKDRINKRLKLTLKENN